MKANYKLFCYTLLFHGICSWEWCSSWKAVVALPWWLGCFVALSIDLALLISLVSLHVQLSEEKWTQGCELSQKFLQSLKSTVLYFFLWQGSLTTFSHPFCFSSLFRHSFPTHLYLSPAVSFPCFCFSFRAPTAFFQTKRLTAVKTASAAIFLPHQSLTLDFWLTLFINIATSDLAGGSSTLQRQEWEANVSLQVFFPIKISIPLRCKGKKEDWKDVYAHERNVECMTNVVPFETIYKGYICCQIIPSYEVMTEVWIAEPSHHGPHVHTIRHSF